MILTSRTSAARQAIRDRRAAAQRPTRPSAQEQHEAWMAKSVEEKVDFLTNAVVSTAESYRATFFNEEGIGERATDEQKLLFAAVSVEHPGRDFTDHWAMHYGRNAALGAGSLSLKASAIDQLELIKAANPIEGMFPGTFVPQLGGHMLTGAEVRAVLEADLTQQYPTGGAQ